MHDGKPCTAKVKAATMGGKKPKSKSKSKKKMY